MLLLQPGDGMLGTSDNGAARMIRGEGDGKVQSSGMGGGERVQRGGSEKRVQ